MAQEYAYEEHSRLRREFNKYKYEISRHRIVQENPYMHT